jgi:uncharacterized membrane protein
MGSRTILRGAVSAWSLRHNKALTPAQSFVGLAGLNFVLAAVGLLAVAAGLWPVAVFCLADSLALVAAYLCYSVHALDGDEVVLCEDGRLVVTTCSGLRTEVVCLDALRMAMYDAPDAAPGEPKLHLECGARKVALGRCVSHDQLRRLTAEIRAAVCQLRAKLD